MPKQDRETGMKTFQIWQWIVGLILIPWAIWATSNIYSHAQSISLIDNSKFTKQDGYEMRKHIVDIKSLVELSVVRTEQKIGSINDKLNNIMETIERAHPRSP